MESNPTEEISTESGQPSRAADLGFSLLLIPVSLFLAWYALRISSPAIERGDATFYTAPGFLILVVSLLILVLTVFQTRRLVRGKPPIHPVNLKEIWAILTSRRSLKPCLVFTYLGIYMWVCWGNIPGTTIRIPFWLGSFLFMSAMMLSFRASGWIRILIISLLFSILIDTVFRHVVEVPLP